MRIGIDASCFLIEQPTGIEHSLGRVLEQLPSAAENHEVALFFNCVRPEYRARFEERVRPLLRQGRIEARFCRIPARVLNPLSRHYPIDWTLGTCDVVHHPNWWPARRQRKGARILTVHDLIPLTQPEYCPRPHSELCARNLPTACESSDLLIAVSHHTKYEMEKHLGVPASKVRVVYHGVDPRFAPAPLSEQLALRQRLGLTRPYLLAIGSYEPRKNLGRLLEAFALVRGAGELELVLAGRGFAEADPLRERLAALGIAEAVRLIGYASDVDLPPLYSAAEAFVFPSLAEGFGMPALEAMACGTPLVASTACALPEIVGEAGLLADPRDPEQLADAMAQVLQDSSLRAQLRARGLVRAAGFTWDRAAREIVSAYEAVAG